MPHPLTPDDLRRSRLLVAGIALVLVLAVVVAYSVMVRRTQSAPVVPDSPGADNTQTTEANPAEAKPVIADLPAMPATSDPDTFSRAVAEALFAWDTTTLFTRADHIDQLIALADPSGASTPGLVADLDAYLPTAAARVELAKYETRQWLDIDSVTTPSTWADAQAQAGDRLLPGTTARTILGTRHRSGIWEGQPVASRHRVAFTIFIVCRPAYPQCRLLRLSMLDKPLH